MSPCGIKSFGTRWHVKSDTCVLTYCVFRYMLSIPFQQASTTYVSSSKLKSGLIQCCWPKMPKYGNSTPYPPNVKRFRIINYFQIPVIITFPTSSRQTLYLYPNCSYVQFSVVGSKYTNMKIWPRTPKFLTFQNNCYIVRYLLIFNFPTSPRSSLHLHPNFNFVQFNVFGPICPNMEIRKYGNIRIIIVFSDTRCHQISNKPTIISVSSSKLKLCPIQCLREYKYTAKLISITLAIFNLISASTTIMLNVLQKLKRGHSRHFSIFSTLRGCGKEAKCFIKKLTETNCNFSKIANLIKANLSFCIVRSTVLCLSDSIATKQQRTLDVEFDSVQARIEEYTIKMK